jgi:hypothetical protein
LFTIKFVVAAFASAALVNYHKNQEHQNLDLSGFSQSPVAIQVATGLNKVQGTHKGSCSKLQ